MRYDIKWQNSMANINLEDCDDEAVNNIFQLYDRLIEIDLEISQQNNENQCVGNTDCTN